MLLIRTVHKGIQWINPNVFLSIDQRRELVFDYFHTIVKSWPSFINEGGVNIITMDFSNRNGNSSGYSKRGRICHFNPSYIQMHIYIVILNIVDDRGVGISTKTTS